MSSAEERLANDPTAELWGEHRSRYRFAAEALCGAAQVLDVACGSGFGLEMLQAAGGCPVGIDYDAPALQAVHARIPGTRLVRADAMRLPVTTESVDAVVSFETIEHVADARALVLEIRRVLKLGGRLVLSTPNRAFRQSANPFHVREFTSDELNALLGECFSEVRLYGQRPSPAYRYVPFLMVERDWQVQALIWKVLVRLPFGIKNRLALTISGKPFYPGEADYCFYPDVTDGAHALVAVAR